MRLDKVRMAITLATKAHAGQFDKAGKPYIFHPIRVSLCMDDDNSKIVALLHDVVEDTDVTLEQIERKFGVVISRAVDAISRRSEETYMEYLRRMRNNDLALKVKFADIRDNLLPERKYEGRNDKKYIKALVYLHRFKKLTKNKEYSTVVPK